MRILPLLKREITLSILLVGIRCLTLRKNVLDGAIRLLL